jgi:hypothetical protein
MEERKRENGRVRLSKQESGREGGEDMKENEIVKKKEEKENMMLK